jgi:hypothetical protein
MPARLEIMIATAPAFGSMARWGVSCERSSLIRKGTSTSPTPSTSARIGIAARKSKTSSVSTTSLPTERSSPAWQTTWCNPMA